MESLKAIIVPGNGDDGPEERWRPWLSRELEKLGIPVINVRFPDPMLARKEYWLPYLKELGADEHTILIGHSSGAVASMRYAEANKIFGSVLIGACYTDLGIENEKLSGYFDEPWDWEAIKRNQRFIIQFASTDDPFIPIEEMRFIRDQLHTEYYEFPNRGHFNTEKTFPELLEAVKNKVYDPRRTD